MADGFTSIILCCLLRVRGPDTNKVRAIADEVRAMMVQRAVPPSMSQPGSAVKFAWVESCKITSWIEVLENRDAEIQARSAAARAAVASFRALGGGWDAPAA